MDAKRMLSYTRLLISSNPALNREFNEREIEDLLNVAQIEFVQSIFDKFSNPSQQGFEDNENRRSQLGNLITKLRRMNVVTDSDYFTVPLGEDLQALTMPHYNKTSKDDLVGRGIFVALPDEAMYIVNENASLTDRLEDILTGDAPASSSSFTSGTGKLTFTVGDYKFSAGTDITGDGLSVGDITNVAGVKYTIVHIDTGGDEAYLNKPFTKDGSSVGDTVDYDPANGDTMPEFYTPVDSGSYTEVGTWNPLGQLYRNVEVRPIKHENYVKLLRDPYHSPYENLVWRLDVAKEIRDPSGTESKPDKLVNPSTKQAMLISGPDRNDGRNWYIYEYEVLYVKKPPDIAVDVVNPSAQQDCELPIHTHPSICEIAARLASGSAIPPQQQYQVMSQESQMNKT